jgi:hypothetical protein
LAPEVEVTFGAADMSSAASLKARVRAMLRKRLKPEEIADGLVKLAKSEDERIAAPALETVLALQGVIVPKKAEETTDQRFFIISANVVPKIDPDIPPLPVPSSSDTEPVH